MIPARGQHKLWHHLELGSAPDVPDAGKAVEMFRVHTIDTIALVLIARQDRFCLWQESPSRSSTAA
jgi:hypothetical protein